MKAALGEITMVRRPFGSCTLTSIRSGGTTVTSTGVGGPPPGSLSIKLARQDFSNWNLAEPPMASTTLAANALPSRCWLAIIAKPGGGGTEAAGLAAGSCGSSGGGGIVMSTLVTGPSEDSGLSNSAVLPTTSTASLSLCRYLAAARATSAGCTF